jgi:hypothetical protein
MIFMRLIKSFVEAGASGDAQAARADILSGALQQGARTSFWAY